jgi:hypothetical protein
MRPIPTPVVPLALLLPLGLGLPACMTLPRMCVSEPDCGAQASCVAGRCVAHGATAAIDTGRRLIYSPVDVAYVRPEGDTNDAAAAMLGGARDAGAVLLLRFSAPIPPEASVLEAYLVLEHVTDIDADPAPVALRAVRIIDPWDSASVSWASQPRLKEVGAPVTRAFPASGPLVRLDVRVLVQRWRRRSGQDFGVAVVSAEGSGTGIAFALVPVATHRDRILASVALPAIPAPSPMDPRSASPPSLVEGVAGASGAGGASIASTASSRAELVGPRLELYVK